MCRVGGQEEVESRLVSMSSRLMRTRLLMSLAAGR